MSTRQQQQRARELITVLEASAKMPSSLRLPLARVRDNSEVPGTADDVLAFAEKALQ